MKSGLVSLLTGESTITDLVGSRVFIGRVPQSQSHPNIVINAVNADEFTRLDGGIDDYRSIDFIFDCRGKLSTEAEAIAKALRTFIGDYTGAAGDETIDAVLVLGSVDTVDYVDDGSDVMIYTEAVTARVFYSPA